MIGLVCGVGAGALGVVLHGAVLRYLPRSWQLPSAPALLLGALAVLVLLMPLVGEAVELEDVFVAFVLSCSIGVAYVLMLNGILHDSPTLALVNAIEAYGPHGMPTAAFESFVSKHPFVHNRLSALIDAGEIETDGSDLRLAGHAAHLLWLGEGYRRLRGGTASESG